MKDTNRLVVRVENEAGEFVPQVIPSVFEVCPTCRGRGVHDHPAFSGGITQAEFDDDPEFESDYFAGRYDVTCEECKGLRVVLWPDEDRMTPEQREAWETHSRAQAEEYAERAMRSRGFEF